MLAFLVLFCWCWWAWGRVRLAPAELENVAHFGGFDDEKAEGDAGEDTQVWPGAWEARLVVRTMRPGMLRVRPVLRVGGAAVAGCRWPDRQSPLSAWGWMDVRCCWGECARADEAPQDDKRDLPGDHREEQDLQGLHSPSSPPALHSALCVGIVPALVFLISHSGIRGLARVPWH